MKTGIWLDHRRAVLITVREKDSTVHTLRSGVEKRVRLAGGSRGPQPYAPQDVRQDSKKDERIAHQLKDYYESLISRCGQSEELYLFGPGEAKRELARRIEGHRELGGIPVEVESADKLTVPQIVERVREHFDMPAPKRWFPPHIHRIVS
jgi:hypothetical protein